MAPERTPPTAGCAYRATVEYDGTDFAGFQVQPGARTVQGELEAALARLTGGERQPVDGAGRTDAGVHAAGAGDRIHLRGAARRRRSWVGRSTRSSRRTSRSATSGGRPARFHPRYAARYREYRYTVWNGPRSPLRERTALGVRVPLDTAAMARAGSVLEGRHDFSAFGAADRNPVRTVHSVRVRRSGSLVTIDVRADAFLRGMVRRIVAVLLEVGRGKMNEEAVREALAARVPALDGATAPAHGLCLRRVVLGRRGGNEHGDDGRPMSAKTYAARESEIERRWYVVDAADETLGRLASRIAHVLEGKHKPTYAPNLDSGDHVIVLNASRIAVSRNKRETKLYIRHSGYPAGLQGGDPRSAPRAPTGGGHPACRQGHAAAERRSACSSCAS